MLDGLVKLIGWHVFVAPLIVQTKINQNAVKPGVKARAPVEILEITKSLQKGLLGKIFGLFAVARETKGDMIRLVLVTLDELLKCPAIAPLRRSHQLLVPRVH